MTHSSVLLSMRESVATITFNRPDVLNVLDAATAAAFSAVVTSALESDAVRVVLLCGAGRAFVAGGDLAAFRGGGEAAALEAARVIAPMHEGLARLKASGVPVVASVRGAAAGAGMSLVLAADFVVAADTARFDLAYLRIGATPDCGSTWTLPRVVGRRKALEIALLGMVLNAEEAHRLGVVTRIVPPQSLEAETNALVARILRTPDAAMRRTKALIDEAFDHSFEEQLALEKSSFEKAVCSDEFRDALEEFFSKS